MGEKGKRWVGRAAGQSWDKGTGSIASKAIQPAIFMGKVKVFD